MFSNGKDTSIPLILKYVIQMGDVASVSKSYSKCMENTTATNTVIDQTVNSNVSTSQEVKKSGRPKAIITRNTDDKIIAGVCSGIANYYDIDPVIVRLIAAMGFLTFGVGPLIYILLWIILPAKQKAVQKVVASNDSMQGALSS